MKYAVVAIIVGCLFLGGFFTGFIPTSQADDTDLITQYAPVFYFTSEETCYPVEFAYHLDNSYLYQYTEDENILITQTPTTTEISKYSLVQSQYENPQDYYLDNQQGTIYDTGIISHYQSQKDVYGYTVYAQVYTSGATTVVQYWMFYAFNKGEINTHEGDWEMVQVVLQSGQPSEVGYSQHLSGQKAKWDDIERDGDHIKVYVAQGSHANYLRSFSGTLGIANDRVGSDGFALMPQEYDLVLLTGTEDWLQFIGHWGEYGGIQEEIRGMVGPEGPMHRQSAKMWSNPVSWQNSLPELNQLLLIGEWLLYNFITLFILCTVLSLATTLFFIYKRYKKQGLGPRIVSMLYIDGFNLKSMGNILCFVGIGIAIMGLLHQWYVVTIDITIPGQLSTGVLDLIIIDGTRGVLVNILQPDGSIIQMGAMQLPFSLLIGIGFVFLAVSTVGVAMGKKLGKKYITQGIRLIVIIIAIVLVIMSLGLLGNIIGIEQGDTMVQEIFSSLSSQPFGGVKTLSTSLPNGEIGEVTMSWGVQLGGYLLLLAGSVILIAGIIQYTAKTLLFETGDKQKPMEKKIK